MESGGERNETRKDLASVTDYGARAAAALDQLLPGPHRDKAVARLFNVSVRMAQYLRSGRFWTAERLSQASRALGVDFDVRIAAPSADRIWDRIGELEREIAALRQEQWGTGGE